MVTRQDFDRLAEAQTRTEERMEDMAVEVSAVVGQHDVESDRRRAVALQRAGYRATAEAEEEARLYK
jgi:hypothetical protein